MGNLTPEGALPDPAPQAAASPAPAPDPRQRGWRDPRTPEAAYGDAPMHAQSEPPQADRIVRPKSRMHDVDPPRKQSCQSTNPRRRPRARGTWTTAVGRADPGRQSLAQRKPRFSGPIQRNGFAWAGRIAPISLRYQNN